MSSNKLAESLSPEELLKALETSETTFEVKHPILTFVNKLDLKPGDHKVPAVIIWEIFNKLNPGIFTKNVFSRELKYFMKVEKGMVSVNRDTVSLYSEILKIKEKPKKNILASENNQKHFQAFLNKLGITKGFCKIPNIIFYHIYRCYCIDNKKKKFPTRVFYQFADQYFEKVRGQECYFYLVDQQTANIIQQKEFNGIKKIYAGRSKKEKKVKKKSV